MDVHRASTPTSRYDLFLFAPICDEANGMRLSVLSALARQDVDPWDEATRLAAMPKTIAEKALVSTLNLVSDGHLNSSEAAVIAARLVGLLPRCRDAATTTAPAMEIAGVRAQRTGYWLLWMGMAITMSLLSPHNKATTAADVSASKTSTTSSSASRGVPNTPHDLIDPSR